MTDTEVILLEPVTPDPALFFVAREQDQSVELELCGASTGDNLVFDAGLQLVSGGERVFGMVDRQCNPGVSIGLVVVRLRGFGNSIPARGNLTVDDAQQ